VFCLVFLRLRLDDARHKFDKFANSKTMVIFIIIDKDFMPSVRDLLEGGELVHIKINGNLLKTNLENINREVRENKNSGIGALAQYYPENKSIRIFHNYFSDDERKISIDVFKGKEKIEQSIYGFDKTNGTKFVDL